MGITESQKKATYKYRQKIELITIQVPKGEREVIKQYAKAHGKSTSAFIYDVVKKAMSEGQ